MRVKLKGQPEEEDEPILDEMDERDSSDDIEQFEEDLGYDDYIDGVAPMEKHRDLLRKLTDFDPYLKKQIMEWLGMYWDEDEKKYVRDEQVDPIMNIKGARWCINFLRTYARDNNILTNISEDVYKNIMMDVVETTFLNIGTRAEYFGIKEDGDILAVCNQLIHATDLVLIGAGGTKTYTDVLRDTNRVNENVQWNPNHSPDMAAKKGGMMAGFKNFMGL